MASSLLFALDPKQEKELAEIDRMIEGLEERKNRYLTSAMRHEAEADRMQFYSQFTLDARWERKLADRDVKRAEVTQEAIDMLKKRREEILKE